MLYAYRSARIHRSPMSDMNITPLIDVLLVLLIMFIMVIPVATHSLLLPLPTGPGPYEIRATNTVHIDAQDRLFWNGQALDREQLLTQLAEVAALEREPNLRFEPDPLASYDRSAKTIALIKDSGVERFAFVGNERYRTFGPE